MLSYLYEIVFSNGKRLQGKIFANNPIEAAQKLKKQKCFIIRLQEEKKSKYFFSLAFNNFFNLAMFSYKLAVFCQTGIPLLRALDIIKENSTRNWQLALVEVSDSLKNGDSLAVALQKKSEIFSNFYIAIIEIAEQVGIVDKLLLKLSTYYLNLHKLCERIKKVLIYPALIMSVLVLLIIFFMWELLPMFASLYKTLNIALNPVLSFMLSVRAKMGEILLVLLFSGLVCGVFLRRKITDFISQQLVNTKIAKKFQELQFCNILALLVESGLDLVTALNLTEKSMLSVHLKTELAAAIKDLSAGKSLVSALENQARFLSNSTLEIIAIGEETGTLEKMLTLASSQLEYELQLTIDKFKVYLQPLLMIFIALGIALVLVVLIQPFLGILDGLNVISKK